MFERRFSLLIDVFRHILNKRNDHNDRKPKEKDFSSLFQSFQIETHDHLTFVCTTVTSSNDRIRYGWRRNDRVEQRRWSDAICRRNFCFDVKFIFRNIRTWRHQWRWFWRNQRFRWCCTGRRFLWSTRRSRTTFFNFFVRRFFDRRGFFHRLKIDLNSKRFRSFSFYHYRWKTHFSSRSFFPKTNVSDLL